MPSMGVTAIDNASLSINHRPIHRRGDIVTFESRKYEVTSSISQEFGFNTLYYCRNIEESGKERRFVLKCFPVWNTGVIAEEGYRVFQKVREKLLALGIPDIIMCNSVKQLSERAPGWNLAEYDAHHDGLSIAQIHAIALQVTDQLAACMELGIVHNDVKPTNIIADTACIGLPKPWKPERVTLIDWDIVRPVDYTTYDWLGSVFYMPPEKFSHKFHKAHRTSDLFSFGVTILDLLCNDRYHLKRDYIFEDIYTSEDIRQGREDGTWLKPDVLATIEKSLTERDGDDVTMARRLLDCAKACIRQNPEDRPQSGAEVREILSGAAHRI